MEEINYLHNILSMLGEWEKIESLLSRSMGGQLRLVHTDGTLLAGKLPPFCELVQSTSRGKALCAKSYMGVCADEKLLCDKKGVFKCHAGLSNFVFPVNYEKKLLGLVVGGAVFADESCVKMAADLLAELHLDYEESFDKMKQAPYICEGELKGIALIMQDIVEPFIASLLQHEHLAQADQELRIEMHRDPRRFMLDEITGVFNPNYITGRLEKEISRASRYKEDLSMMVLEIENLPYINEEYGHEMGDVVLKEIASILKSRARDTETVARLSGTRFGIIFPRTAKQAAEKPLQRLKNIIADHAYELDDTKLLLKPLVKMSVVEYTSAIAGVEEMLMQGIAALE